MKFFRIDLLTLLISLFILSSCKNPDGIGLPVDPSKALQTSLIDTATILTTTVPDDSVLTSSIPSVPLAYFKDPIFGTTEANIATTLNLPASYVAPTGTVVIDSAMLVLKYAGGFYGDSLTTNYKVNVYQLTEPIVTAKAYYNTKVWSYNASNLLGSLSFYPRPNLIRPVKIIVPGGPDTIKKEYPQIRIKINPTFVYTNLFGATANQLGNNTIFQNFIKGLYITLDKSATTGGPGGNMFIDMTADSSYSKLDVYYHSTATDGTIDTEMVSWPLGNPHAAQIKHDYSTGDPAIQAQLSNPKASYGTVYVQGLSGLRAKISFPYLKKIIAAQTALGGVVLNRAELVVTPVTNTYKPFQPPLRLTMYRNDIALQRQLIPDANSVDLSYISVGSFGGFYDNYHQSYHYIITGYVQDLMLGKLVDYGTYIAPTDTTGASIGTPTIDITPTAQVGGRAVLGGDNTSAYRMKLNIIYNKVVK